LRDPLERLRDILEAAAAIQRHVPSNREAFEVAECPSVPGAVSQGRTQEEALEIIKHAIKLCLKARRELGLPETVIRRTIVIPA